MNVVGLLAVKVLALSIKKKCSNHPGVELHFVLLQTLVLTAGITTQGLAVKQRTPVVAHV